MAQIPPSSFQGPLAPKFGLTDNARSSFPLKGAPSPGRRNYSGLIPVVGIAIAILVIPLTIQQLNQKQDVRQNASGISPTVPQPTRVITPSPTPTPTISKTQQISPSITPGVEKNKFRL